MPPSKPDKEAVRLSKKKNYSVTVINRNVVQTQSKSTKAAKPKTVKPKSEKK